MVSDDGERISDNLFSVGSGSIYAYSILDAGYKCVKNLIEFFFRISSRVFSDMK